MDIKNSLEVLKAAEVAGKVVGEMLSDGKINLLDLPKVVQLFSPLKDAVNEIAAIPAELSDLSGEEVGQLVNAVTAVAAAWVVVFNVKAA